MDNQSGAELPSNESSVSTLPGSEQYFRAIWEVTLDAMLLTTPEGEVIAANPAFFQFSGYTPEAIRGQNFLFIIPEDAREQAQVSYFAYFQHAAIGSPFETTILHADGSRRIVTINYSVLIMKGVRSAMLMVIRDITESNRAAALENARLYEQMQTLAAIQERQRLARELHDTVSQELYSISLGAQIALEILDSDAPQEAKESIEHVIRRAAAALLEMRALIFELIPEALEDDGLIVALTRHVEMLQTAHQLRIETFLGVEPAIPLLSKHVLYRVTQEALHNVIKHASASKIDLRLTLEKLALVLEVRDNGKGFDPAGYFPNSFGLRSMRERVKSIQGTISIASTPGRGTLVSVRLPL